MTQDSHSFPLEEEPQPPQPGWGVRRIFSLAILGALAFVLALIAIDVALISAVEGPTPRPIVQRHIIKLSGGAIEVPRSVYLSVSPSIKPGPDGRLHDAFSVTDFDVRAGRPIKLVIHNADDTEHSITSPSAGVDIVVRPGTHTYTLLVRKTGVFQWYCKFPCDPYSMTHKGYMRGTITSL